MLRAALTLALLAGSSQVRVDVRLDCEEADAVLESDLDRLFRSDGYLRLNRREEAMGRGFTEAEFRRFVESPELAARAPELATTLARWRAMEVRKAAKLALDYLPANARIWATVFPVIKPQNNTFVFEPDSNPAIFFSIDPKMSPEQFENTLAHELHHIGYANCCPTKIVSSALAKAPAPVRAIYRWIGAFGEGFAMLAAAGGPDIHPHAVSAKEARERWDREMARCDEDLQLLEAFFRDVLEGKPSDSKALEARGMSFFGAQGPWYTVGWQMAVTIERAVGRERLLECMENPSELLPTYCDAIAEADEKRTTWSEDLIEALALDGLIP